ncbi:MAG TPA: cation:proton antiporter [Acidimicrobiales bacterium]|nr:cation:proton antiporter [Acidimicrobiales bacterium]
MLLAAVAKAVAPPRSSDELAAIVFIDIAIIVTVARLVGSLFKRIRQPAVVGEIIAGIALGPSLLGLFPGHLTTRIFPTDVRPYLNILAQVGLIIFMFIVGLEVDVALIRGKERVAGVISLSSIALPFGLGILLASAIHSSHTNAQAPQAHRFLPFALFIGASMSITAFPVLARILTERQMYRTEIGALALACAAVDDVVAWSLLALVLAVIKSSGALSLPRILLEALLFVAFMFLAVRPGLEWLAAKYRQAGRLTPNIFATVLVGFLVSSYITERIGIHQIFGAFLFGVVMPRKDTAQFFHDIVERLEQVSVLLLLPLFFIVTGFSVDLRHLGSDALTQLPFILLVAVIGKLLGATLAARAQGLPGRKAGAIGVLMNTRGLTELIILNVGLQFGVLDIRLFSMLVVMAVLTTIMTEPLLRLVYPEKMLQRDIEEAEKAALGTVDAFRVLALIGGGGDDDFLVDTAADVIGDEAPAELVLTSFSQMRTGLEVGTGLAQELGQMATVLDHLKALSGRAESRAVRSVVRSQFSDDVATSLVAQAAAVEADVLLVPIPADDGAALSGAILSAAAGEVVFVVDGGGGAIEGSAAHPVAVVVSEGADGAAALELATRVAFSRHTSLRLIPETSARKLVRHAAERADELAPHLDAQAVPRREEALAEAVAAVSPCLVVSAVDRRVVTGAIMLLVRAAADDDGRGLERWLRRTEGAPG